MNFALYLQVQALRVMDSCECTLSSLASYGPRIDPMKSARRRVLGGRRHCPKQLCKVVTAARARLADHKEASDRLPRRP